MRTQPNFKIRVRAFSNLPEEQQRVTTPHRAAVAMADNERRQGIRGGELRKQACCSICNLAYRSNTRLNMVVDHFHLFRFSSTSIPFLGPFQKTCGAA
jgi:hypothetical protein